MTGRIVNIIVIILEAIGLSVSISDRKWKIFAYYTQISNLLTIVSSIVYVLFPQTAFSGLLRYLSSCMLTMTFLVTLFVLVPMGGGFRNLMLSGNGLYHHTLCPVISVLSYIFLESHVPVWYLPPVITLVYGITMMYMNHIEKFDGPYPFFRVNHQSVTATIVWIIILFSVISVISLLLGAV